MGRGEEERRSMSRETLKWERQLQCLCYQKQLFWSVEGWYPTSLIDIVVADPSNRRHTSHPLYGRKMRRGDRTFLKALVCAPIFTSISTIGYAESFVSFWFPLWIARCKAEDPSWKKFDGTEKTELISSWDIIFRRRWFLRSPTAMLFCIMCMVWRTFVRVEFGSAPFLRRYSATWSWL